MESVGDPVAVDLINPERVDKAPVHDLHHPILAEDFGNKPIDYTPPRRSAAQPDPKDIDEALDALLGA